MSTSVRDDRLRLEPVTLSRTSVKGDELGAVVLDPEIFSVPVNVPLLHQVITAQLAARRSGTQSTKTRAEVRGGSSKPYRQKGTGNARQGSIRAPHYSGGGVALGPKPRDYAQRTPRKMVQAALRCALSDRARSGGLRLIDRWAFDAPRTKQAIAALGDLECEGTVLLVLSREDELTAKSFANLSHVVSVPRDQLTAYDVLSADVVVFTDDTLPGATSPAEGPAPARKASAAKAPAKKAPAKKAPAAKAVPAESEAAGSDVAETGSDVTEIETPATPAPEVAAAAPEVETAPEESGETGSGVTEAGEDA